MNEKKMNLFRRSGQVHKLIDRDTFDIPLELMKCIPAQRAGFEWTGRALKQLAGAGST